MYLSVTVLRKPNPLQNPLSNSLNSGWGVRRRAAQSEQRTSMTYEQKRLMRPIAPPDPEEEFGYIAVRGEALSGDDIRAGDVLITRLHFEHEELTPGRLVVVASPLGLIAGHLFFGIEGRLRLASSDPRFEDDLFERGIARVIGVVVKLERYFDDYDDGPGQDYMLLSPL